MNKQQRIELTRIVTAHAIAEHLNETAVPGLTCIKASSTDLRMPILYTPSICLVIQGEKKATLEEEVYNYKATEYAMISVDLPVMGQVTEASKDTPYLSINIDIDAQRLSELLPYIDQVALTSSSTERGMFIGKTSEKIGESVLRLTRLLDSPSDIPVLAPIITQELYYHLLKGEYGKRIAQVALKGSHTQRISGAIQKIKAKLSEKITVDELAELVGMSVSSFHAHFKSITAMSPLQFQKRLRLMEARNLILTGSGNVSSCAYKVGYESPSQFSREYLRMFGHTPGQELAQFEEREKERTRTSILES